MKFNTISYINSEKTYEVLEDGIVIEYFRLKGTARTWIIERKANYPEREYEIRKSVTPEI